MVCVDDTVGKRPLAQMRAHKGSGQQKQFQQALTLTVFTATLPKVELWPSHTLPKVPQPRSASRLTPLCR